jgi:hypothetical protein
MEQAERDREYQPIGPAERPDDPLGAWHKALRAPLSQTPKAPDRTTKQSAVPSTDQEGCYFIG